MWEKQKQWWLMENKNPIFVAKINKRFKVFLKSGFTGDF